MNLHAQTKFTLAVTSLALLLGLNGFVVAQVQPTHSTTDRDLTGREPTVLDLGIDADNDLAVELLAVAGPPDGTGGCGGTGSYMLNVIGGTISRTGDTAFNNWAVGYKCWGFDEQFVRVYIVADDPATFDHWESPSGHLHLLDGHNGTSELTIETSFNLLGESPTFEVVHTGGDPTPDLITINGITGTATIVGPLSGGSSTAYPAIAIEPRTKLMYAGGGDGAAVLHTVDPATGSLIPIGPAGSGITRIGAMDFRRDGTLFASVKVSGTGGPGANYLATIDPATGLATLIGSFGSCDVNCSIAGIEAIAFDGNDILYAALHERAQDGTPGLYTINTSTGWASYVTPILDGASEPASGGITSLQFVGSALYGGTAISKTPPDDGGWLVRINKTTGLFWKLGTSSATGGRGLIGLAAFGFECEQQSDVPIDECEALVDLFYDTDGVNWRYNVGWNWANAVCTWHGVICEAGHVTRLFLNTNRLSGPLPESIGDLSHLTNIDLSFNSLTGPIPASIGDLSNLNQLWLGDNKLSGPIPESIGNMSALSRIWLSENNLAGGIPEAIGNLTDLTYVEISNNPLITGPLPESIGNLTNLENLWLEGLGLTGSIPESIGNMASLQGISVEGSNLTGAIPESIGNLTNLLGLNFRSNDLTGRIPASIGNLSQLFSLDLRDNDLTGPIPLSFGELDSLRYLYLNANNLEGTVPLPAAETIAGADRGCNMADNPGLCVPDLPPYQALVSGGVLCGIVPDPSCEPIVHAEAKVFLEGPYSNGVMQATPAFTEHCPNVQPYSDPVFDGTPLDYDSPDVVLSLPDSVMDWVLVSLRSDIPHASEVPGSERAAFLRTNGSIVDTSGTILAFPGVAPGAYRLVVRHRNHASAMSADTLDLSDGIGSWDFTTAMTQAYTASGAPMKTLPNGRFGMFACDANVDGQITAPDFNLWNAATTAGQTGYRQADCNLDGQVTAPDFNLWNANTTAGARSQVPD